MLFVSCSLPGSKLDNEGKALAARLHESASQLMSALQTATGGSSVGSRMLSTISSMPAAAAADLLASVITRDAAVKLAVLQAVEVNERLQLVLGLVTKVGHRTETTSNQHMMQ